MSYFLEILYEDNDIVVINKPAGLAVHGGNNVKHSLMSELRKMDSQYELLHRLDRETSGVLVLIKNKRKIPQITHTFNQTKKYYWVIVHGKINKKKFVMKNDLFIDGKKKNLESRVSVLQRFAKYSLLEVQLITGRKHQIRRQCQFIAHPVVGDKIYGDFTLDKEIGKNLFSTDSSDQGNSQKIPLMLCAKKIIFNKKGKTHTVQADLPSQFDDFLKKYNVRL